MFPIFDFSGRIVGFSGRLFPEIEKEGVGKYINSPETILYNKSKILYGFDKAKTEIRKKDACVLVEGQMDVLMSHQADITNAVAVSGIGLTPYHLETISRLTNNLIVAFDKDEAGLMAAGRGIDLALEKGFEVRVVSLPFGKDPADVASKNPEAWQKAAGEASHIIDFYLQALAEKITDPRLLKLKVEQVVLPYLTYLGSEIDRSHWISEIAKCLKMREEPIWEETKKIKLKILKGKSLEKEDDRPKLSLKTRRVLLEEHLLGIVFWRGDANIISDRYLPLFSEKHENLLQNFHSKKGLTDEEKKYCDRLALEGELCYSEMEEGALEKELEILLGEFEREFLREEQENLMEEIRRLEAGGDEKTLLEKLNKFNELSKKLSQNQFKNETKKN